MGLFEPEFLGDRSVIESQKGVLEKFVKGFLKKGSLEPRESYRHVVDMKYLLNDFNMNSISDRSFVCRDRTFFQEGFNMNEPYVHRRDEGRGTTKVLATGEARHDLGKEEEKKRFGTSLVIEKKKKQIVEEEDLGFCFGQEDDEDE
jgi:hypothetical protein